MNSRFIKLFLVLSFTILGCTDDQVNNLTNVKKGSGGNGGGGSGFLKPDEQVTQKALEDKVLLWVENSSKLNSADEKRIVFTGDFKINARHPFNWSRALRIQNGEVLGPDNIDQYLGEDNLKLQVSAYRISKSDQDKLGNLVLMFNLEREESATVNRSITLILVDLKGKGLNSKAIKKVDLIYPVTNEFSLQDWIDKNIK